MSALFDLARNPFYVLGAHLHSTAEEVIELRHETVFDGRADEGEADKAQHALTPTLSRLQAEVRWLADAPLEEAGRLAHVGLDAPLEAAMEAAREAPPLARANLLAHLTGRFPGRMEPLELLVSAWESLDQATILGTLSRARRVSGWPQPDPVHVDAALRDLMREHARQVCLSLDTRRDAGAVLTRLVERAIAEGNHAAILEAIVRDYDAASEPRLIVVRERIDAEIARCRAALDSAADSVVRLTALLKDWDAINQPVQLLEQALGHEEPRSRELCGELRGLSVWLANERRLHREALSLARALLDTFPELDSVAEQLRSDVETLEEIVRRLPPPRRPTHPGTRKTPHRPSPEPLQQSAPPKRTGARWAVLGIGAALIYALFFMDESTTTRPSAPSPAPAAVTAPAVSPFNDQSRVAAQADLAETPPPPGRGRTLSAPELRYCIFQSARLDHLRTLTRTNPEIDRFNAMIGDYNSRCGDFRYRSGALSPIERQARERAATLRREAEEIIGGWRPTAPILAPGQPAPLRPPPPDASYQVARLLILTDLDDARRVQARLSELGYYRAAIDGLFGNHSRAALRAFKFDHPLLPADEVWDLSTQGALFSQ